MDRGPEGHMHWEAILETEMGGWGWKEGVEGMKEWGWVGLEGRGRRNEGVGVGGWGWKEGREGVKECGWVGLEGRGKGMKE